MPNEQASTHPGLGQAAEELRSREPLFHTPQVGTSRTDLEATTAEDFWEVGASGRRYSRDYVLDTLGERGPVPGEELWEVTDFDCRQLCDNTFAVTYLLRQEQRFTRRLTLWRRTGTQWKALYHQGTVSVEREPNV